LRILPGAPPRIHGWDLACQDVGAAMVEKLQDRAERLAKDLADGPP
jgi:hypothetical protein